MDEADKFPGAQVFGFDLSPIQRKVASAFLLIIVPIWLRSVVSNNS